MNLTKPSHATFPLALDPPDQDITILDDTLLERGLEQSRRSPRGRIILPLHKNQDALVHRMLNCIQPHSYIRPHRHLHPPRTESIIVLRGALLSLVFTADGQLEKVDRLAAGSPRFGIDSEPGLFHTFLVLEPDTVIFEIKPGPYHQSSDKDMADWAPAESSPEANAYLASLYQQAEVILA